MTVICQGANSYRKKFPVSKALTSLQILSESFFMLLLQSYILANAWGAYPTVPIGRIINIGMLGFVRNVCMVKWKIICWLFVSRKSILILDYSYLHVACALMSIMSLAKEYSEHHTYELSGKSGIPPCNFVTSGFFYYVAIIFLRLPTLLLLLLLYK